MLLHFGVVGIELAARAFGSMVEAVWAAGRGA